MLTYEWSQLFEGGFCVRAICMRHRWAGCGERRPNLLCRDSTTQIILCRRQNIHSDQPPFNRGPLRKKNWRKIFSKWKYKEWLEGDILHSLTGKRKERCVRARCDLELRCLDLAHSPLWQKQETHHLTASMYSVAAFQRLKFHKYWYVLQLDESHHPCRNKASTCSFSVSQNQQKTLHLALAVKTEVFHTDQWKEYHLLTHHEYLLGLGWGSLPHNPLPDSSKATRKESLASFSTFKYTYMEKENTSIKNNICKSACHIPYLIKGQSSWGNVPHICLY